jgi:hypothetical protein
MSRKLMAQPDDVAVSSGTLPCVLKGCVPVVRICERVPFLSYLLAGPNADAEQVGIVGLTKCMGRKDGKREPHYDI